MDIDEKTQDMIDANEWGAVPIGCVNCDNG